MPADAGKLYEKVDSYKAEIEKLIRSEFAMLSLTAFDRLNVIQLKKKIRWIYGKVVRRTKKRYAEICLWAYEWAYAQYGAEPGKIDWTEFVDEKLRGYDPVTQYVFLNEIERKELRLEEAIMSTREISDHAEFEDVIRRAANLLYGQCCQVALNLNGAAETTAYHEIDVLELMWHTTVDGRECADCRERDGAIYPIEQAPTIPAHRNCRCFYTPVKRS